MLDLQLRAAARRDRAGIWTYTKRRWSKDQADRYLAAINPEIERLREKPTRGRPVKDAQAQFLKRNSGSHVIFYLVDKQVLDIVRVLHSRMDFITHLANDDT